ncbi:MAG: hypothetical protein Q9210_004052 [Variospora velana]
MMGADLDNRDQQILSKKSDGETAEHPEQFNQQFLVDLDRERDELEYTAIKGSIHRHVKLAAGNENSELAVRGHAHRPI